MRLEGDYVFPMDGPEEQKESACSRFPIELRTNDDCARAEADVKNSFLSKMMYAKNITWFNGKRI